MSPLVIFLILSIAVSAVLLAIGFLSGYSHWGRASHTGQTLRKLRDALAFERKERMRIAREHFETSSSIKMLEAELHELGQGRASAIDVALNTGRVQKEVSELKNRYDHAQKELSQRKIRIADLQAELSMAQAEMEVLKTNPGVERSRLQIKGQSLKEVLDDIVQMDGIEMALVADDQGLVVDASVGRMPAESLALLSSIIGGVNVQLNEVLAVGQLVCASLTDENGMVFETRFFELFEVRCSLIVAHKESAQYPRLTEDATFAISSRLV